jgi:hypothetical protein
VRRVHTITGWLFVLVFLSTGLWMRLNFPEAYHDDEALRLMFRASHIYILASALLNLMAGIRRESPVRGWRLGCNRFGSVLLLASAPLLTIAFIVEPAPHAVERPLAHIGVGMAGLGTVLIVLSTGARHDAGA